MISKVYSDFFKELEQNNHKDWFHANKKRYEADVKIPFIELLSELILQLRKWDDRILPNEKKRCLESIEMFVFLKIKHLTIFY